MKILLSISFFFCFLLTTQSSFAENKKCQKLFSVLDKTKDPIEQYNLGIEYYKSRAYKEAFVFLKKSAKQGNVSAQYYLVLMYYEGQGVSQNYEKSEKWFKRLKKAAWQGDASAQYHLGLVYNNALGVPKNYKETAKWFEKSAQQGDVRAQFMLAGMHYYGDRVGVPQDFAKAFLLFKKAAEQGHISSQHHLGQMYEEGQGVTKDRNQAALWYKKASDQGYLPSSKRFLKIVN